MSAQSGRITGRAIEKNRDGTVKRLLLQVEITDPEDIQTVELMSQAGIDTNPPDDSLIVIVPIGEAGKVAVAVNDGIEPDPAQVPGDYKIYSSLGGAIKAFVQLLTTGAINISGTILDIVGSVKIKLTAPVVEVNGSADFAVRFLALEVMLIALKAQLDIHVHDGVTTGISNSGPPTSAFTTDITAAKVTSVTLP